MSIFYASHEEDITVARADVLSQTGSDQTEVHQIVYNYDLNALFDPLFVTIVPNADPSVILGNEIDDADVLDVHDALKEDWESKSGFIEQVKHGLEKLFQRFETNADESANDTNDGFLSSNVKVDADMVQAVLENGESELRLNMMSKSQIKSIAQSLIDLHKYQEVDGVQKLNLEAGARVVSYSNVIDSDNSDNKDKWEIVLNHTPAPAAPAAPAAPTGTNVKPADFAGPISKGINNYTPSSSDNMPFSGPGPYAGLYIFDGNPMTSATPIFLDPATGIITLLNQGTVATLPDVSTLDTSLNANWNIVVTATGITFTYA